ncbi:MULTISPECIES: FAD-dependent oxidoreductase [unclassified Paenibacillus]|uniref:FAD-dependent oxidoreductase n=1 Tax=unclassified Paenibacillus TaxID=185978 RepID=UPI001AE3ABB0|nr:MULTISPECIES: FAD-dependent oxidoreductase [unclassified Paenibacillus]MBP1156539.1 ribulose 1,5-bisphosphate synthetase/thiazole synthase [Paenibacillus sp. PvP091]MBP1172723.1 ribulose 1,5-bisphosphate synthetase/thiazole synthase [Paenibacillus sp. PvR098]MBP2439103.1 ribulose 1,5-bisphosphate synthetase/thiazole synthase [Paenibacillus sp. PvP052]
MAAKARSSYGGSAKGYVLLIALLVLIAAGASALYWWKSGSTQAHGGQAGATQKLAEVKTVETPKDSYDLIVAGTDPEGVAAAVSAARNGLKTLLVDEHNREILGGLMSLGWLNSLDMNYEPDKGVLHKREILNKGIFTEWYAKTEGDSFDVITAANAFNELVAAEKNVDVLLKVKSMEPVLSESGSASVITGMKLTLADGTVKTVQSKAVIDATQDADIAAAAGVPYTTGREDLGDKKSRMAVTLVFRLKNITPDVWQKMKERLENDNDAGTGINEMSAWGYKDMKDYPPMNKERVAMRGLNIGRQNNDTMLINALQIFGIDGTDPKSKEEAFHLGKEELPHIVEYMKKQYPEFAGIELDATAPELYVRESRHIQGEYRLSIIDVLENRDQWDRIGFGSYPVDIQRMSPADTGAVVSVPQQYAVPFRSIVPLKVDGLLVVGRAASFDTLPHGTARVIPVGMATAEAAGAAVKIAEEAGLTFRQMSANKEVIALLQDTLNKQGLVLQPYSIQPQPFMEHKQYEGLKVAVTLGLATGGYDNNFALDAKSNQQRVANMLEGMRKFKPETMSGSPSAGLVKGSAPRNLPVSMEQAAYMIALMLKVEAARENAVEALQSRGFLKQETVDGIANKQELTNGDTYLMIKDVYNVVRDMK